MSYRSQESFNETLERKCDQTHISGVYPSQGQTEHDIHDSIYVENPLGKGREIFMTLPIQRSLDNWAGNI